jgi:uncharacterized protein (DUF433 family)
MQLEDYFDFLGPDDIRIKGHRIGIETVLYEFIHRHRTPEQIVDNYRSLTLEEVYATILYYYHNQAAVTKYLEDWLEHGDRMLAEQEKNPPPGLRRLMQLDTKKILAEARAKYETNE